MVTISNCVNSESVSVWQSQLMEAGAQIEKLESTLAIKSRALEFHRDRWCGVSGAHETLAREIIKRAEKPGFKLDFRGLFDEHGKYVPEDRGHGHNL